MDLSGTPVPDKSIPCASRPERYAGLFQLLMHTGQGAELEYQK